MDESPQPNTSPQPEEIVSPQPDKTSLARWVKPVIAVLFVGIFCVFGVAALTGSKAATPASVVKTGQLASYLTNSAGKVVCLDDYQNSSANGAAINIYPCSTTDAGQKWSLYSDNTIRIHGKCLEVYQNKTANNSRIDLYTCNNGNNQKWTVGKNVHLSLNDLVSMASGKCLDVHGSATANSSPTDLFSCNGTTAQVWGWNTGGTIVQGGKTVAANCHGSVVGGNNCYYWAQSFQQGNGNFTATGVSANFSQPDPVLGPRQPGDVLPNHSVMEIWAASADNKQIIEIGWYKDNTRSVPIVFATAWANGQFIGYAQNGGTGFVQVSQTVKIGSNVKVGTTGSYKLVFSNNQWQIWYNGTEVGYFPESVWSSRGASYTQIGYTSVYGEVGSGLATVSKTQMGNGTLGGKAGAATVSSYSLIGSTTQPQLTKFAGPTGFANAYTYGNTSNTGFSYGGPGF